MSDDEHKLYVHRRGGDGRSVMIAAIIYGKVLKITDGQQCLIVVKEAHKLHAEMKSKYRKMGPPQTVAQKNFVLSELL